MIRRGIPTAISTFLGVLVAFLTNVFTDGWWWPVGVGLGCAVVLWIGWEIWRASRPSEAGTVSVKRTGSAIAHGSGSVANTGAVGHGKIATVDRSGDAEATGGSTANTGAMDSDPDLKSDG